MSLTVTVHQHIAEIAPDDWDASGAGRNPFTTHRFLAALEDSGSVGQGTGWIPAHLAARDDHLLAIATGKSRRGVERMCEREGSSC